MWTPDIGERAGRVWDVLRQHGPQTAAALRRLAKLDEKWLYLSLGWLAREGKIAVSKTRNQVTIALK